jgi:hypothetical protein
MASQNAKTDSAEQNRPAGEKENVFCSGFRRAFDRITDKHSTEAVLLMLRVGHDINGTTWTFLDSFLRCMANTSTHEIQTKHKK